MLVGLTIRFSMFIVCLEKKPYIWKLLAIKEFYEFHDFSTRTWDIKELA